MVFEGVDESAEDGSTVGVPLDSLGPVVVALFCCARRPSSIIR